jgi:molecular chaperone DnaK (HSP70)
VFRHRPNHPALREKRQAIVDRARQTRAEAAAKAMPAKPTTPNQPRGAVVGLAYGGHVAAEAARAAQANQAVDGGGLPDVTIEDVTTHPLGIIVLDKERRERVVELIPEGTRLPHQFKGRFAYAYDNMTAVRVEVTEGVGTTRDEVTVIGKVELTGLPPRPRGTEIQVLYLYGVDQILRVQVVDVESGVKREVDIHFRGGMSSEQVQRARGRNREMSVD